MTKNRPKNGSLNRDLLNFLYRYGIFWMPPGESSHPGGSEYVWQRGVEGVLGRVTGGRSLPYFPKKKKPKMSRSKKFPRPQFSKYRLQIESAWAHSLWQQVIYVIYFFVMAHFSRFFFENRVNLGRP